MKNHNKTTFIGIDVSKEALDIWDTESQKHQTVDNSLSGIKKIIKRFSSPENCFLVIEATGVYQKLAHRTLAEAGFYVSVVNPYRSRKFADILGKLAKTDKVDAKLLAIYGQRLLPEETSLPSSEIEEIQELVLMRRQLVEARKVIVTQAKNLSGEKLKKISLDYISFLESQIESINEEINRGIPLNKEVKRKFEIMTSVKGVGPIVSATLLADMQELGTIEGKQASSLCGVAPFNWDSGMMRGKRKIKGGRQHARNMLYMAAHSAVRHNEEMRSVYKRLVNKGKAKKIALVAVMRKMIVLINCLIKEDRIWQENPPIFKN